MLGTIIFAMSLFMSSCKDDTPAGPSEVLVIADKTCNPEFVAADLLSQAEHDEEARAICVTTSQSLADKIKQVNLLESLPFDIPEKVIPEEKEVIDPIEIDPHTSLDEDGQINLFKEED